jgi:hypothetical protein
MQLPLKLAVADLLQDVGVTSAIDLERLAAVRADDVLQAVAHFR